MADVKLTHVPYRGTAPALTDLIGGHVQIYFSSIPSAIGIAKEGKVRALAVTGPKRSPVFPDLPTVAETLPGFEAVLHYGIVAPAGTPKPIIDKLNAALRDAVVTPDTRERMAADGTEPLASTPEEYAADIDKEETKWSAIVKKSGAKASEDDAVARSGPRGGISGGHRLHERSGLSRPARYAGRALRGRWRQRP
jgi:tripartite-type tricarboxylate transporter receptor subunit TctC